jgi:SAM-dependent methyltransferase
MAAAKARDMTTSQRAEIVDPAVEHDGVPQRGAHQRRTEYASTWPPDEFIVPLLKQWIEAMLRECLSHCGQAKRVLDVGCGRQPFRKLIESLGAPYVGMDVHQTPDHTVAFLGQLDGPLPDTILAAGPYDLVLCTEVLEHVANWSGAFENLAALVAPGGFLLLTCPHFYQLHEEPYDFWRPTSYAIEHYARQCGFLIQRIERLGNAWDVLGAVLANMWPVPFSGRLRDRLAGRFFRVLFRGVLFPLLRRRWPQRRLDPQSQLYLANAAVLVKT